MSVSPDSLERVCSVEGEVAAAADAERDGDGGDGDKGSSERVGLLGLCISFLLANATVSTCKWSALGARDLLRRGLSSEAQERYFEAGKSRREVFFFKQSYTHRREQAAAVANSRHLDRGGIVNRTGRPAFAG